MNFFTVCFASISISFVAMMLIVTQILVTKLFGLIEYIVLVLMLGSMSLGLIMALMAMVKTKTEDW